MFHTVVACDSKYGIAKNGIIPWECPKDLSEFRKLTTGNIILMGRKTYQTILPDHNTQTLPALKNRINLIVSDTFPTTDKTIISKSLEVTDYMQLYSTLFCFNSILDAVEFCKKLYLRFNLPTYVVGGASIYQWFIERRLITTEYITELDHDFECDQFYPKVPYDEINQDGIGYEQDYLVTYTENSHFVTRNITGTYSTIRHRNKFEQEFLNFGSRILYYGNTKSDRTGTGTISLFGNHLVFDLSNNVFPLLTTRKMFLRGIFEELMLYLRGQTDNTILESKGISVWTANTTREFLDSRGLQHLPVGDMGPSYGFLFRYFGAKYVDCKTNYTGQGVDQLTKLIHTIKTNPADRRMIISLWDPVNLDNCPLPPCLYNYQFYVADGKLSCMMTQRSSDYAVAGGWNVATGALLTIMLASITNLLPGTLTWNMGDTHVYKNLTDDFSSQLRRAPYTFPLLYISKKDQITDYEFTDLKLVNYLHHDPIAFKMSV